MFEALYQDGRVATDQRVVCMPEGSGASGMLLIADPQSRRPLARWKQGDLFTMASRRGTLRIGCFGELAGARLIIEDMGAADRVRAQLPTLQHQRSADRARQLRTIALSMVALVSVIVAYIVGIPMLANRVVAVVSPHWETQLGEAVAEQVAEIFATDGELELCDPDPGSAANTAIARFSSATLEGLETPFDIRIAVVRSEIPNAIALPGGRIYYFEGLLRETGSADEFAGVLAHEIGHVVNRHGMEQLVASAGTGLLVGLVLGDVTGLSVAGALGSMLVDSHFSREHELQADRFARDAAMRLGFNAEGLADLLDRVSSDDDFTRNLALLSTHPLTEDRRAALATRTITPPSFASAFDAKQWYAISHMCD